MTAQKPFDRAAANELLRILAEFPHKSGYWEAAWMRDLLLMTWVIHHPMRLAELFRIAWRSDNTGHLFKDDEGAWSYRNINAGSAMLHSAYKLARPLAGLIEAYIAMRPQLLKKDTDALFYMPSTHLNHRVNTLMKIHFGRAVSFSELRTLGTL